jgi:hypothetical protein
VKFLYTIIDVVRTMLVSALLKVQSLVLFTFASSLLSLAMRETILGLIIYIMCNVTLELIGIV